MVGPPSALRGSLAVWGGALRFPWKWMTRWWFETFFFSPLPGEDSHFDYTIFFRWVETTNQMGMEPVQKHSIAFAKIQWSVPFEPTPPPRVLATFWKQVDNWIVRSCLVINTLTSPAGVLQNLFCQNKREITIGGGFKYVLFSPLLGEDFQFWLYNIFEMGWFNHQPESDQVLCHKCSIIIKKQPQRSQELFGKKSHRIYVSIFTYIWWICMVNVGKYTSPMDPSWELLVFLNSSSGVLSSTYYLWWYKDKKW